MLCWRTHPCLKKSGGSDTAVCRMTMRTRPKAPNCWHVVIWNTTKTLTQYMHMKRIIIPSDNREMHDTNHTKRNMINDTKNNSVIISWAKESYHIVTPSLVKRLDISYVRPHNCRGFMHFAK